MLEARLRRDGAPKHGDALLAGLLRCRRCVRKLTVRYTGAKHDIPRYSCWRGLLDNGEPRAITAAPRPSSLAARDAAALGTDLRTVWEAPTTDARLKKRVVRTVNLEVVAEIDDDAEPWLNLTNAARLLGVRGDELLLEPVAADDGRGVVAGEDQTVV